ncbi:SIR2 family protein [Streptomyces sp. NBC_00191]|uniref:SIR2 family protein n=1 Tax=Streptomyces sp. NBC_00191 TaxID=2975674 RepID=UPI00324749DB
MSVPQFGDMNALLERVNYKVRQGRKRCAFVVGSGLTRGEVPGTEEMIGVLRRHLGDAKTRRHFDLSITASIPSEKYQQAAAFARQYRGQEFLNDVVRRCTLKACDRRIPSRSRWNEDALEVAETDYPWTLGAGVVSLGEAMTIIPHKSRGPILTTNFDPLLEIAIQQTGGNHDCQVIDDDYKIRRSTNSNAVGIVHMHGYWRMGNTLHTALQLRRARPELAVSLRETLRDKFLVVIGYGGWSDAFTRSLLKRIEEKDSLGMEIAWSRFSSFDSSSLGSSVAGKLLRGLNETDLYEGIDANTFFPKLVDKLKE